MVTKPEWVTLPLNERAAKEAELHTEQANTVAKYLNDRVTAMNQPSTQDSFNQVVTEALRQPDYQEFLRVTAGKTPYPEEALNSIFRDVQNSKATQEIDRRDKQLISDTTIEDSFGAETANALLSAVGLVPVIGGNLVNLGVEGV